MAEKNFTEFHYLCNQYLDDLNKNDLQQLEKFLPIKSPMALKKGPLVEKIIEALSNEKLSLKNPQRELACNTYVREEILETIASFQEKCLLITKDTNIENEFFPTQKAPMQNTPVECTIQVSCLTPQQKKLFFDFLNSL